MVVAAALAVAEPFDEVEELGAVADPRTEVRGPDYPGPADWP